MPRVDVMKVLVETVSRARCAPFVTGDGAGRIVVKAAPGRLDVMGALGALAGGTVAQMALPAQVAVAVQALQERVLVGSSAGMGETRVVPAEEGKEAMISGEMWGLMLLGAWKALGEAGVTLPPGMVVRVESTVPAGAGQASSTALLTALAGGLLEIAGGAAGEGGRWEPEETAALVARAEAWCGLIGPGEVNGRVVDALTCLVAEGGKLLRYSAQPHRLVGSVPLPADLRILALDTGVRAAGNDKQRETLEELRIAGAMGVRIIDQIYADLGQAHTPLQGYLANTSPLLYRQYFRMLLPKRLRGSDFVRTYGAGDLPLGEEGAARFYRVRTVVDHLMAEHEHAEQFVQAMEELEDLPAGGTAEREAERQRVLQRAGRLALASHHSYRLRLELSCPEADWLVDRLMEAGPERGVYGARITGAGAGGTVMALVNRSGIGTDALLGVMTAYQQQWGRTLGVVEAGGR